MRTGTSLAYWIGIPLVLVAVGLLLWPAAARFHAAGPANRGHETIACGDCHRPAPGTVRQQIQANVRYWLGLRPSGAWFRFLPVTNQHCLACHQRPNDTHPAHRFLEPRFAEARQQIEPQYCISCHREHSGVRVTAEITDCRHCHEELRIKKDPIDPPHRQLVDDHRWSTCLACHDYHGNHIFTVPKRLDAAFAEDRIVEYFRGGPSPYGTQKQYAAKESLDE